jgi:hypothetical protein
MRNRVIRNGYRSIALTDSIVWLIANLPGARRRRWFALNNKWSGKVDVSISPDYRHRVFPTAPQSIDAKTVFVDAHDLAALRKESHQQGVADCALEHGVLNTLAIVLANLGYSPEAPAPLGGVSTNIVAYEHVHWALTEE